MSAGAVPVVGYAPDMDPATPGIITACTNIIPNEIGMETAPLPFDPFNSAAAVSYFMGCASLRKLDGTARIIGGDSSRLYELTGSYPAFAWTTLNSGYSLTGTDKWVFAQFGDSTLAATRTVGIQRSTGSGFSTIAGAPLAQIVVVASGFAVAFNTSTASDEWYCSAYLDETNWTLDVTSQCVKGRLTSSPGEITAALPFGDDIIAYKDNAVYRGVYVGAPAVWQWTRISTNSGCSGVHAVCNTPDGHYFASSNDIFLYDGTAPVSVAVGRVKKAYAASFYNGGAKFNSIAFDRPRNRIFLGYSTGVSTYHDSYLCYHLQNKTWGAAFLGYSYALFTLDFSDDNHRSVSGSVFLSAYRADTVTPVAYCVYAMDRKGAVSCSFATNEIQAEDGQMSYCDRFTINFEQFPRVITGTGVSDVEAVTSVQGSVVVDGYFSDGNAVLSNRTDPGKYDMRQTGHRHKFTFSSTGTHFSLRGWYARLRKVGGR